MSTAKENPCRKFQANFFNKSKCQNCFKPRELHLLTDQDLTQVSNVAIKVQFRFLITNCSLNFLNCCRVPRYTRAYSDSRLKSIALLLTMIKSTFCLKDSSRLVENVRGLNRRSCLSVVQLFKPTIHLYCEENRELIKRWLKIETHWISVIFLC